MQPNYPKPLIGCYVEMLVPVSFESGKQVTALKLPTKSYRYKVISLKSVVTKAIAASDDASITIKKGSTTIGTVTLPLSSALGTEASASSVTETQFETTDQLLLTT